MNHQFTDFRFRLYIINFQILNSVCASSISRFLDSVCASSISRFLVSVCASSIYRFLDSVCASSIYRFLDSVCTSLISRFLHNIFKGTVCVILSKTQFKAGSLFNLFLSRKGVFVFVDVLYFKIKNYCFLTVEFILRDCERYSG